MTVNVDGAHILVGVVSFGKGCGRVLVIATIFVLITIIITVMINIMIMQRTQYYSFSKLEKIYDDKGL